MHGGYYGCEMLRIPLCLDSKLTDGSEFVSLMFQLLSTPQKYVFSFSYSFLDFPGGPCSLCFPTKTLYMSHAAWPAHLTLFDYIILIIFETHY
jgi:hypothetical protein